MFHSRNTLASAARRFSVRCAALLLLCWRGAVFEPAIAENLLARLPQSHAARAACGPVGTQVPRQGTSPPAPVSPPDSGKALVYFYTDATQSFGFKAPLVSLGIDGAWVGATIGSSYVAVNVSPGIHHLCSSLITIATPQLVALERLNAEAGKTYFFTTRMLNDEHGGGAYLFAPADQDKAAMLAEASASRIDVSSGQSAPLGWGPNPEFEAKVATRAAGDACGSPAERFNVMGPGRAAPAAAGTSEAQIILLLDAKDTSSLIHPHGPVLNAGVDGSWVGGLQGRSYVAISVAPGVHHVCFEHQSKTLGRFLALRHVDAQAGHIYYISALMLGSYSMGDGGGPGPTVMVLRGLDRDEGRLAVETSAFAVSQKK